MAQRRQNSFFGGAATLALAIALVKIIGAIFKIPIVSILGDGYADFYDAYNIYTVLLTVSTAGLPAALSKMVAANHALGRDGQVQKIFRLALTVFFGLGLASFLIMFFGAQALATHALNNEYAAQSIRFLAPAVVFVSCLGAFRGYAQGHSNMLPSAVSQVIEALGKLVIGLPLAYFAVKAGREDSQAAALAILGVTIGSALALLYMLVDYARHRPALPRGEETQTPGVILRELLSIAIPITLTSSAVSIINLIDAGLVKGRLQDALGYTVEQSRSLYAAYSGGMTIYNLPASFMIAVTASVIPAISSALARKAKREASRVAGAAIHMTALLVFPMGVGMCVLGTPIVKLLFHRLDPELSGPLLSMLGVASIFVCLVSACNSVMQAYGYQSLPVLVMIGCGIVKIVVNYILVAIPAVNIYGAPIGTLSCFALAAALDFFLLKRIVPHPPRFFRLFFGPALAAAVMGLAAWGTYALADLVLGNTASTLLSIVVAVGVYAFLVLYLKLLSRSELKLMPKGDKIADLLRLP